jgi:hypothetical protein
MSASHLNCPVAGFAARLRPVSWIPVEVSP